MNALLPGLSARFRSVRRIDMPSVRQGEYLGL